MREDWIDNLKGIGIALVVLGHMKIPEPLGKLIFSFHMPLFFFISGYLFKGEFSGRYVRGKIDHLIVPYIVYALPLMCLAIASGLPFDYCVRNLLLGNGLYTNWFLSSLFTVSIFGGAIVCCCHNWILLLLISFSICVLGQTLPILQHPLVLSSHTWAPALVFWLVGFLFADRRLFQSLCGGAWLRRTCVIVILVLVAGLHLLNIRPSIAEVKLGNPFLFYPAGLALIALNAIVCRWLGGRATFVRYLGRNSLLIMIWHVAIPAVMMLIWTSHGIDPHTSIGWRVLYSGINLLLLVIVVVLIDRYASLLSGRVRVFTRQNCEGLA